MVISQTGHLLTILVDTNKCKCGRASVRRPRQQREKSRGENLGRWVSRIDSEGGCFFKRGHTHNRKSYRQWRWWLLFHADSDSGYFGIEYTIHKNRKFYSGYFQIRGGQDANEIFRTRYTLHMKIIIVNRQSYWQIQWLLLDSSGIHNIKVIKNDRNSLFLKVFNGSNYTEY